MNCDDFYFDGHFLSEFNMRVMDSSSDQEFVQRNVDMTSLTDVRSKAKFFSTSYSAPLTLNFLIMKNDEVYSKEDMYFSGDEINMIRTWLESAKTEESLSAFDYDEDTDVVYYGLFTNVQPNIHSKRCNGLNLTFTCNAPYGYSEEFTKSVNLGGAMFQKTISIYNSSAEQNEILYPKIYIDRIFSSKGDCTLSIINNTDDGKSMDITLPNGLDSMTIDCERKMIFGSNGKVLPLSYAGITFTSDTLLSTEAFSMYWFGLVSGNNSVTVAAKSENIRKVEFKGRFVIKSGGF